VCLEKAHSRNHCRGILRRDAQWHTRYRPRILAALLLFMGISRGVG
jgi:hypothetical protein